MSGDFSPDQKRYLEGFMSGLQAARAAKGVATGGGSSTPGGHDGPDASHLIAQEKVTAAGGKLVDQEKFKREEHPFDAYPRLRAQAARNEAPKPPDNFRWRYFGLFYVAPAQNSYMCRLRIANGILTHWQFAGVADLAERYGGGYAHVTTRANLQIREIEPRNAAEVVERVMDLGLSSRGAGADNIRNVTGTPTAGIDPLELIDTRPYAREFHFHILNDRSLYGLPRKFNVAFEGAGTVAVLEDTNDIGFQAVEVCDGVGVPAGIYFRLMLGGITGHKDLARNTGIVVRPQDATPVADAILRVFIERGDRTNRNKARLKYVLDALGFDAFLELVEEKLGDKLTRVPADAIAPRPVFNRIAHVGVHPQKQVGLNWIGVVLPVGRLTPEQMRGLSRISQEFGDGDIRMTVWQNLLLSGIPDGKVAEAEAAIAVLGLATEATAIRAGLVACTGSRGCRFAASDTKSHAEAIAAHCEARVALDSPINIHLTGCHHSCAQHYIGDIGLIGARVSVSNEDTVDGYHVLVGGGYGPDGAIGREFLKDIMAEDAPGVVERLIRTYLVNRTSAEETFAAFTRRADAAALQAMYDAEAVA